jgi:prevent-host-death family protein
MKKAAVARLKAELSRYLRLVKAGEEIVVTEHDVPVARIVPVRAAGAGVEAWRDLERQGLIRLGSSRLPAGFGRMPKGKDPRAAVRAALRKEREEGW